MTDDDDIAELLTPLARVRAEAIANEAYAALSKHVVLDDEATHALTEMVMLSWVRGREQGFWEAMADAQEQATAAGIGFTFSLPAGRQAGSAPD